MNLFNGFNLGFKSFFKAIPFIFKNKLGWTLLIPVILNIILYAIGFSLVTNFSSYTSEYINSSINIESQSEIIQFLPSIISWIIKISFHIILFFTFSYFGGYIILIILSPLFAWISEYSDQIINETNYPFNIKQFFSDIWYGIIIAIRNSFLELLSVIIVLFATFIPIINIITGLPAAIFLFFISSYFYGFSYIHYNLERRKFNAKNSILFIKKHKGIAIANGMIFSLSLFIPFIGIMLSGITAIIATVGATIAVNNIKDIDNYNKTTKIDFKKVNNTKNATYSHCTGRYINYK